MSLRCCWAIWVLVMVLVPTSFLFAEEAAYFKMTAEHTYLSVGQEIPITIWAHAPNSVEDNGILGWQFDMCLPAEDANVVFVKEVGPGQAWYEILGPKPSDGGFSFEVNKPYGGLLTLAGGGLSPVQISNVGVGGYSEIARMKIIGSMPDSNMVYQLNGEEGTGFFAIYGQSPDNQLANGVFDAANSDRVFTVVRDHAGLADIAKMGMYWMSGNCSEPEWCGGADWNEDGKVDWVDFSMLAWNWQGSGREYTTLVSY